MSVSRFVWAVEEGERRSGDRRADVRYLRNSYLDDIARITAKMYFPTDGQSVPSSPAMLPLLFVSALTPPPGAQTTC